VYNDDITLLDIRKDYKMKQVTCQWQENCRHYKTGNNNPPNQHVRETVVCNHYLAMDCIVMPEILKCEEYCLDKISVCDISKRHKAVKRLKGGW